jgi:hypothetical protein
LDERYTRGPEAERIPTSARIVRDDGAADLELALAEAQGVADARVEDGEQGRIDEAPAAFAQPSPESGGEVSIVP